MISSLDVWEKYDNINKPGINPILIAIIVLFLIVVVLLIIVTIRRYKCKPRTPEDRLLTADVIDEMPLDDFLDITEEQYRQANDIGIFILYNLDKEKYYIGMAPLCADAVNREIIGKGSPDIFYEKKNGDEFTVQFYFMAKGSAYKGVSELYHDAFLVYSENFKVTLL